MRDEQQQLLERRLSVKSFPTYLILDKQGKVVSANATHPRQGANALAKELLKWLEQ